MSFKPVKLQSENARLRDEIRSLQRALNDISKDVAISNPPISPINSRVFKPKARTLLYDNSTESEQTYRQRSALANQWTPSKKENVDPYTYVASFGVLVPKHQPKRATSKHADFQLIGVSPTFRDCGSPVLQQTTDRSDRTEQATAAETKFDSEGDIEFFPSISPVGDTKSGISLSSSFRSDMHRIDDLHERYRGRKEVQFTKASVKDTFSSFYDAEDTGEEHYTNQSVLSIEAELQPGLTNKSATTTHPQLGSLGVSQPPPSSLMKTIEALREENRMLRTKIEHSGKAKTCRRSKSPAPRKKSPSFQTAAKILADTHPTKPASPFRRILTPPPPRGRRLSRPRVAKNPSSTSRQATSRAHTSRSAERNKSAVLRVRHCDTCDHLLSKGFSTAYCSRHGNKPKHDRSSSIDLLTQRSFEAIKERNAA